MLLLLADGSHLPVTELPGHGPWTFLVLQPDAEDPVPGPGEPASKALGPVAAGPEFGTSAPEPGDPTSRVLDSVAAGPEPGASARFLTRYGRAVVPELRGRPGFGERPGAAGFLRLVDDLDQVRTRAGLGRPVLVGLGALATVALRAGVDQPWAWRALLLAPAAGQPLAVDQLEELDFPVLVLAGSSQGGVEAAVGGEGAPLTASGEGGLPAGVAVAWVDAAAPWEGQGWVVEAVERLLDRLGTGPGWAGIAPDAPPR